MVASFIRYQFPALEQAVGDIDNVVTAMDTTLTDLHNSVSTKLADWQGDSGETFASTEQKWLTAASNIKILLFEIRDAVNASNEQMFMTEMRNAARLTRG
jgi:WXG100 family type VII secretion target